VDFVDLLFLNLNMLWFPLSTLPKVFYNQRNQNPSKRKPPSDRGVRKSVSKRDMYRLRRNLRKMPGATSKRIFKEADLPDVAKTTRNNILGKLGSTKTMIKRPSLTPRHKRLRMEWSRKL
jgi:hypothetical protein